jgi:uncharacterized protein (DUF1800 family)
MRAPSVRLTRRQVLGMAATGAAGAAGIRLLTLLGGSPGSNPDPSASLSGPYGSWDSPLGRPRALAAHLLRRAAFGYTDAQLDAAASMSYPDLVDQLLAQRPQQLALPQANPTSYLAVTTAWYQQMATTGSPFPERMALFWHGHLTSDFRMGGNLGPFVWQQNQLYRNSGRGKLRDLMLAVTYDPLMDYYLNLEQSTGAAPNENYSREVMEIFCLGPGHYTETDVRESARALSGIVVQAFDQSGQRVPLPRRTAAGGQPAFSSEIARLVGSGAVWKGVMVPSRHDSGTKTFLGHSGNLGPDDIIDIILAQPACAPFITTAALTHFSVPSPSAAYVNRIATEFQQSGYDISTLMREIFLSPEFTDPGNYRSLVRDPAEYMVATLRALQRPDLAADAVAAGVYMNQVLYDPPNVGGWPANSGWIDSGSWLGRLNFAALVMEKADSTLPDPVTAVTNQLDAVVGPDTARVFNASQTDGDRWYAILASPEFHLK